MIYESYHACSNFYSDQIKFEFSILCFCQFLSSLNSPWCVQWTSESSSFQAFSLCDNIILPICWEILIWSNLSSRIWFKSLSQNPETSLRQSASSAHLSGWGILARRIRRKEKLDIKYHIWVDQSKILGLPDSKSKKSRQRNKCSNSTAFFAWLGWEGWRKLVLAYIKVT